MTKLLFALIQNVFVFLRKRKIPLFFILLLTLYFLPMIIQGENSYITIHDNLDGLFPTILTLAKSGHILNNSGSDIVPQIMGGIPRSYLPSGLNIISLIFLIFKPYTAYLINHILVHVIAFIGMYLLLNRYLSAVFNERSDSRIILWGVSTAFAILPFYTLYGLSIAGQPLLIYSFLNILNDRENGSDYFFLLLFPFYSYLYLSGVFLIVELLLILLLYYIIIKKKIPKKGIIFLGLFIVTSIISEYDLIRSILFNPNFITQRSVRNLEFTSSNLNQSIKYFLDILFHGQNHAASHHEWILILAILVLLYSIYHTKKAPKLLLGLLLIQLFISILYGLFYWDKLIPLRISIGFLSSFDFSRMQWLSPCIWYIIFFLSLKIISGNKTKIINQFFIISIISIQLLVNLSYNSNFGHYINQFVTIPNFTDESITYQEFFSPNLFSKINNYINLPPEKYHVVNIGIFPSIAQYNGFYTIDGYQSIYPLEYKQKFRKIIAPELEKNSNYKKYFDYWGSRCYIFSSEISSFKTTKYDTQTVKHLDLDSAVLKDMGVNYIFSAVEIENFQENHFKYINIFEDKDSIWRIYLYQVE